MALSQSSLKQKLIQEFEAKGFVTDNEFSQVLNMAEIIANAVVAEVTQNAQVNVTSGSSAGIYKVS